jgi:hypothetical protein
MPSRSPSPRSNAKILRMLSQESSITRRASRPDIRVANVGRGFEPTSTVGSAIGRDEETLVDHPAEEGDEVVDEHTASTGATSLRPTSSYLRSITFLRT